MEIILVPKIGFCFGVKRAVDISVETFKKKPRPCQVLGPLVHNEFVIEELRRKGIKFINSLGKAKSGTVIIPAHGEDPKVLEKIKKIGLGLVDATCPLVTKVQNLAKIINNKGRQVIIIGDRNHKEVKSIQATISGKGIIISDAKEIPRLKIKGKSVGVLTQTTQNPEKVKNILKKLKNKFRDLKFYNTLCPTVQSYQTEVKKLAPKVDLILIVGSKNSANTKRLVEIAKEKQKQAHHIENARELKKEWLLGIKKVGVAGGTSTPGWLIKEVIKKIAKNDNNKKTKN